MTEMYQPIIKSKNIDQCFPNDMTQLALGKINKAFVKPMMYKFGSNFKNKSEETRFSKVSDQIVKLRHLLITDPKHNHEYILKFLLQFYNND
jgi:hypothetical protein